MVFSSSDWTLLPHHRESAHLSPLTTGLFGHPQDVSVETSKVSGGRVLFVYLGKQKEIVTNLSLPQDSHPA